MKKIIFFLLAIISFGQSSCERDDICAESTPTTPLLIIRFYDAENPTEFKTPNNLAVLATESSTPTEPFLLTNSDSIALPLRTNEDITTFSFILNTGVNDIEAQNIDVLTFNYNIEEEYVSKACGFRVFYEDLDNGNTPLTDGPWIQDIVIENQTVNDQTEAHISIFH